MSISLTWCKHGKGVFWQCSGELHYEDIQRTDEQLSADPRFPNLQYVLINTLNTERVVLTEVEIKMDVTQDAINSLGNENLNVVFVSDKPELQELGKVYVEQLTKKIPTWHVQACSSLEQAKHWLTDVNSEIDLASLDFIQ